MDQNVADVADGLIDIAVDDLVAVAVGLFQFAAGDGEAAVDRLTGLGISLFQSPLQFFD